MPKAFISGCAGLELSPDERAFLSDADPWGLILFKRNVADRDQLRALTQTFRACVGRPDAPVLIDQEGGRVQRLGPPHWLSYPAAGRIGAEFAPEDAAAAARLIGRLIAHDLREVGITVDCAPVLDVADPGAHAVIGTRAWSESPERVTALGRAFAAGLLAGGVAPVVKHMPGHGRARADSHLELPVVTASHEELAARDFAPFRALADAPAAMSAHIVYTALDADAPATLSEKIVREIIRGEIGFSGLLISDDLSMKALKGDFGDRTRGVFAAGLDLALHCNGDLDEGRPVAEATPWLAGPSLARAEAALARVTASPPEFDADEAYGRLLELWPALAA